MADLGRELRNYRALNGKNQGELGQMLGVPQSTISKWERGIQSPSAAHFQRLQKLLNIPLGELLGLERHENSGFGEMDQTSLDSDNAKSRIHPLFGSMKGTTIVMPGVDLAAPADPDLVRIYDEDYDPQQLEVERVKNDIGLSLIGKIWRLDELGMRQPEIASTLDIDRKEIDAAFAVRKKARGW